MNEAQTQTAPLTVNTLVDFKQINQQLDALLTDDHGQLPAEAVSILKHSVTDINQGLQEIYRHTHDANAIVYGRANLIDQLIHLIFSHLFTGCDQSIALIAVGGYGRGELHPRSDIDLMILLGEEESDTTKAMLERFLMLLWDIKLEIGHSVRTIDECVDEAKNDITVATNIMESRLLAGEEKLFTDMKIATAPDKIWDSKSFFQAKLEEQIQRNGKFNDTAYNLEPNIKESRGGLRDIQMIGWVAKRHFNAHSLNDLVYEGFLLPDELDMLIEGQELLWKIRCSLHYLSGRREDRLLFDYQRDLALEFGYLEMHSDVKNEAIEQFMQRYYRTVIELERLNEMLLQHFREVIIYDNIETEAAKINDAFQVRHGYLETTRETIFKENPCAILEMFLILQDYPDIHGVRAETIREVRRYRHLINDNIRQSSRAHQLFMKIMTRHRGVSHELRRMNRYGIIAAYIPAFNSIVGRMQYDLFHTYTVDQHTLFVIRNMRRLAVPEHCDEFPLASGIFLHLPNPGLLYIAGLFHDIAKGRNGDHSELGAVDALEFCKLHGMKDRDANLVSWLVRHHLLMSVTAQRKDLSDPDVINEFAEKVGTLMRLDYLYLLTICDIRATNPKHWNSWKDKLFSELYNKTASLLNIGIGNQADRDDNIQETQTTSLRRLERMGIDSHVVQSLWRTFPLEYFQGHTAQEIVWQTSTIIKSQVPADEILTEARVDHQSGSIELMVYMKDRDQIFYDIVTELSNSEADIVSAHIINTSDDYALETFWLIPVSSAPSEMEMAAKQTTDRVSQRLRRGLDAQQQSLGSNHRHRYFTSPTEVSYIQGESGKGTQIMIDTLDRTGVLANIAKAFLDNGINILNARITTAGERAIDHFNITNANNLPLDETQQQKLREQLTDTL
jgi:[protein-PII] uridylyltransferase